MRLDRLENEDAELVFNACMPRGHFFAPVRQFGQRFSFVREYDSQEWVENPFRWDPGEVIRDALALSRLVRDNGFSLEWAARIVDFEDGQQSVVYAPGHEGKLGYRVRQDRDWLDPAEGVELGELLACFWDTRSSFPERVNLAMWRLEYAYSVKWADVVIPILVSGLEALLKTERHRLTEQFASRASALASEVGLTEVDRELAERIYDMRSAWIHGAHVPLLQVKPKETSNGLTKIPIPGALHEAFGEVALLQDLLRRAVRRCIEDEDFRQVFVGDDAIRARWPVPVT